MSSIRKSALAMVIPVVGAIAGAAAGPAHAAGNLYGAIAVGNHQIGYVTDYPTQAAADQAAKDACGVAYCTIKLQIKNSCGAAAQFDARGLWGPLTTFYYGTGATAADAERMALAQVPHTPFGTMMGIALGSSMHLDPFIRATVCTSNAG
ncbi:DUF4189 domain-containing protein [Nocardia brasiliensis]